MTGRGKRPKPNPTTSSFSLRSGFTPIRVRPFSRSTADFENLSTPYDLNVNAEPFHSDSTLLRRNSGGPETLNLERIDIRTAEGFGRLTYDHYSPNIESRSNSGESEPPQPNQLAASFTGSELEHTNSSNNTNTNSTPNSPVSDNQFFGEIPNSPLVNNSTPPTVRMPVTIDQIMKMIPDCSDDFKNLNAFVGTCNMLHGQISVDDRPLFCLMVRSRAKGAMYELLKDLQDDAGWEAIKSVLSTEVAAPLSRDAVRAQIAKTKQRYGESIQDYARRMKALHRQLNEAKCDDATSAEAKKFVKTENERFAKQAFEDGVQNNELRIHVRNRNEDTLAKAIALALDNEARFVTIREPCGTCGRTNHSSEDCHVKKKTENDAKKSNGNGGKGGKGNGDGSGRNAGAGNGNSKKNGATPKADTGSSDPNAFPNITCHRCKQKGHYANTCPQQTPQGQSNGSNQPKRVGTLGQGAQPTGQEMQQVANRFAEFAQIHSQNSENFPGQNA